MLKRTFENLSFGHTLKIYMGEGKKIGLWDLHLGIKELELNFYSYEYKVILYTYTYIYMLKSIILINKGLNLSHNSKPSPLNIYY